MQNHSDVRCGACKTDFNAKAKGQTSSENDTPCAINLGIHKIQNATTITHHNIST
jgi:hypothetical protein